jgi:hypothetical protein
MQASVQVTQSAADALPALKGGMKMPGERYLR